MAWCQVGWRSEVLAKQVGSYVILPDAGHPPFPVYYLLHGLSDDHTTWQRRTRIEWYVRELPLIVVMPDGFRGFYTNHENGHAYATYMAEELPAFIERNFPAVGDRAGRCVGGLSMGGYGALRLALGYPTRYVSANSHSGALAFGRRPNRADSPLAQAEFELIVGTNPAGGPHDLHALAAAGLESRTLPHIRIDCGTEDFLLEDNREFAAELARLGVPHQYEEFPGSHSWDYWDLHVREALAFHARHLGIEQGNPA